MQGTDSCIWVLAFWEFPKKVRTAKSSDGSAVDTDGLPPEISQFVRPESDLRYSIRRRPSPLGAVAGVAIIMDLHEFAPVGGRATSGRHRPLASETTPRSNLKEHL